jgi:hypothetical protein
MYDKAFLGKWMVGQATLAPSELREIWVGDIPR